MPPHASDVQSAGISGASSDPPQAPFTSLLRDDVLNDRNIIFLSHDQFMKELLEMFKRAEEELWEGYLYPPWNYILAVWCLTLASAGQSVISGPQYPFLYRIPGFENKVAQYVLPDFVLICTSVYGEGVFMVIEVKALRGVSWNTIQGREKAVDVILQATDQVENQARLAFLRHPRQRFIRAVIACAVWWRPVLYDRYDFFGPDDDDDTPGPTGADVTPSLQEGSSADRLGSKRKSRDHARSTGQLKDLGVPALPSISPIFSGRSRFFTSERSSKRKRMDGEFDTAKSNSPEPARGFDVYHVLRLGYNGTTSLNPWFRAFLRRSVSEWPVINNIQKSWFDLTPEEDSRYVWKDNGHRSDDGFEDGYVLPDAEQPEATDDPAQGIERLCKLDSANPSMIADISTLMSPRLDGDPDDPELLQAMINLLSQRLDGMKLNRLPRHVATPRGGPAPPPPQQRQPVTFLRAPSANPSHYMAPPSSPIARTQRAVPSVQATLHRGSFGLPAEPPSSDWEVPPGSEDVRNRHHDLQRDLASVRPRANQDRGSVGLEDTQSWGSDADTRRGRGPELRTRSAPQTRASSVQRSDDRGETLRALLEAEKVRNSNPMGFRMMTVPPNTQSALRGNPFSTRPREVLVATFQKRFSPQDGSQTQQAGPSNEADSKGKRRAARKETE
ncbi:hypothetical protein GSI_06936 [Ganoderma sinense ZZ0214-1]|uniref:Uncharacterized protein n=1 Tax=Ganoderma sinense ZZ0214-1 TaxID=1077348 RepID=A0A2G8SAY8_9APHY|nr:hypothetical protein GSI_06936 [Ganoderma sinense ZZ0214-1]